MSVFDLTDQPLPLECGCRRTYCCGCVDHPEQKPWKYEHEWLVHWSTTETCSEYDPTVRC